MELNSNLDRETDLHKQQEYYFKIGTNFENGADGSEQNYLKALEYYKKAADIGCLQSMHNVGLFYAFGKGVEKDSQKAFDIFLKNSENGFAKSMVNVAASYSKGFHVEKDYSKTMEWLLKASESKDPDGLIVSFHRIGHCYENGKGVEKDMSKAIEWYLKSNEVAEQHAFDVFDSITKTTIANNQNAIGLYYQDYEYNYPKAFPWLLTSAKRGNTDAQILVGMYYQHGYDGVDIDRKKACFWAAKGSNNETFEYIEEPFDEFAIKEFELLPEEEFILEYSNNSNDIIVRFEEKDFEISKDVLKSSKYLSTMMNPNWKDNNEKYEDRIILDLSPIQSEIFREDEVDVIQLFESYINCLKFGLTPNCLETKLKLIEMAKYLSDDDCFLSIINNSNLFEKFLILSKFGSIERVHIAILSCFIMDLNIEFDETTRNLLDTILSHYQISPIAYEKISNKFAFEKEGIPDKSIFHILLSSNKISETIEFNNESITFEWKSVMDNHNYYDSFVGVENNCKDFKQVFGKNSQVYIQISDKCNVDGFWENGNWTSFYMLFSDKFESLHILIFT